MITLVLGGARSGKSEIAEGVAAERTAPVLYFATADIGDDDDLAVRVAAHRDRPRAASVRRALAFLTPLPVGTTTPPDRRTLAWFPVVGALIGGVLGGVWWMAERVWPSPVAAGVVVAADLALTGLLHLDGL